MYVKVLGSVSPYPNEKCNGPGFLIEQNGDNKNKILLDCGSGTTKLMNMKEDLNKLTVLISHLHKDHYSGLADLAYASYCYHNLGYLNNKIDVYIPNDVCLPDFNYLMNFGSESYLNFKIFNKKTFNIGDFKISISKNPHQVETYSIKIEDKNATILYSADTGYKNNTLEKFSKDADLLICESTFLKGQNKPSDNHLYAYEAAMIAKNANVKKLLLTHFWPEIDKQEYVDEAKFIFNNVDCAKENDKILVLRR